MARNDPKNLVVEDAEIFFRNFSGEERMYNPEGERNFSLGLDPEFAEKLRSDGWNVKALQPREDDPDDVERYHLKVKVRYNDYPPTIYMITGQGKTLLTEETVGLLDYADIAQVDLIVNPYTWNVGENSGVTAYLKSAYVTLDEDELASKYYDVPLKGGEAE